jgi:non-ribosomal peptide synthetase component F
MQPIQLLSPFRFIQEQGITVWFSVPSVAALLRKQNLLYSGSLQSLRLSFFCGEALPQATAEVWQRAAPQSIIENLYGPTELTIACTSYRWDPLHSPSECVHGIVPIGQPNQGHEIILLDDNLTPVATGMDGELCVSGPQMFPGYWRDPQQTSYRLIELSDPNGEVKAYYRTGDKARFLPSGNLAYLGRMDDQIKVMGYRIELSEIEGMLSQEPGVVVAAAVGWPLEEGAAKGICAFVVGHELDIDKLNVAIQSKLPAYMVPRSIIPLGQMPLNTNGKIDRNALLEMLAAKKK